MFSPFFDVAKNFFADILSVLIGTRVMLFSFMVIAFLTSFGAYKHH